MAAIPASATQNATPEDPPISIPDAASMEPDTITQHAPSSPMPTKTTSTTSAKTSGPKHKPFPSIAGGCICSTVRYRLLTSPLFVYACHCPDCQKITGSAFGLFLNIETYCIRILSQTQPVLMTQLKRPATTGTNAISGNQVNVEAMVHRCYICPNCKTELWSKNVLGEAVADVRVGTLDFPGLMEPDVHSFVESKVGWLRLPEGARTVPRGFKHRDLWPKSSLRRLDLCLKRLADAEAAKKASIGEGVGKKEGLEDGEKTPTAIGGFGEGEDDEAFERRYKETERALQERLEKLKKKLEQEDGGGGCGSAASQADIELEKATEKLHIGDEKSEDGPSADPGRGSLSSMAKPS